MGVRQITYAQNREDLILSAFFPNQEKGFYVDLGAQDPVHDSATKLFYDRGWRGINVEPNKKYYKLLLDNRPHDININLGVADAEGELLYREYTQSDGLSTFSTQMQDLYEKPNSLLDNSYIDHMLKVTTLQAIFEKFKVNKIDFLKIDIEGLEYEAIIGNDWSKYAPKVICIEANHIIKDWRPILIKNGYRLAFDDGLNHYYLSADKADSDFQYVRFALAANAVYYLDHQKNVAYNKLKKKFAYTLIKQAEREHELNREIVHRNHIISDSRTFKNSLFIFLLAVDNVVNAQIGRFNHPKRKNASKGIEIPGTSLNDKTKAEILKLVRKNDLQNFYSTTGGSGKYERQIIYPLLHLTYRALKKLIKLFGKPMYKFLLVITHKQKTVTT